MDHGIVNEDKVGPGTDGNNGCGNDPDREDDNNGWCGRPEAGGRLRPAAIASSGLTTSGAPAANVPGVEVLGQSFTRTGPEAGGLAITGADVVRAALTAGALLIVGLGLRRSNPPRSP